MEVHDLARRAAVVAVHQRKHGDRRSLRALYLASFSLLRYLHRAMAPDGCLPR